MSNHHNIPTQLFAIPKGYDAWAGGFLMLIGCLFFLIIYGSTSFISAYLPWRIAVSFQFENSIPFIPMASLVYLSMMPLLALAPFILHRCDALLPFFWVIIAEIVIAGIFFLVIPMDTGYSARKADGVSGLLFDIANFVNMKRNFFPSLHVSFAFTAAFFYSRSAKKIAASLFYTWAVAISISTILIHEHYFIDVIAGFFLALICWKIVEPWAMREDVMLSSQKRLKWFYASTSTS